MDYIKDLRRLVGTRPLLLPGALVVIADEGGQIMLTRRVDTGEWSLPGGHMEPGESIEDTARREALEETGLVIGELRFLGMFSGPDFYYRYPNGDEIYKLTVVFAARHPDGDVVLDAEEAVEAAFFAPDALPADLFDQERKILERLLRP